jgi:hypothetical protein
MMGMQMTLALFVLRAESRRTETSRSGRRRGGGDRSGTGGGISAVRAVPLPGRYVRDWLGVLAARAASFCRLHRADGLRLLIQGFASRAFGVPISWAALPGASRCVPRS